jgi:hypothetical protein
MESKPSMNNLETVKSQDLYKPQGGIEHTLLSPEIAAERRIDMPHHEVVETAGSPVQIPPLLPTPIQAGQDDDAGQVVDDTPLTANDDDLIEKEWVDKAKQIIVTTRDDPYRREQEVAKLQADYLRKRYGKELGSSQ